MNNTITKKEIKENIITKKGIRNTFNHTYYDTNTGVSWERKFDGCIYQNYGERAWLLCGATKKEMIDIIHEYFND